MDITKKENTTSIPDEEVMKAEKIENECKSSNIIETIQGSAQPESVPVDKPMEEGQKPKQNLSYNSEDIIGCEIKLIKWKGSSIPILLQLNNGPCPLIAIINWLILSERLLIPVHNKDDFLDFDYIIQHFGSYIMNLTPPSDYTNEQKVEYENKINRILDIIYKFRTGIHISPKFGSVDKFENSEEISVFNVLGIPLYHAWIPDPAEYDLCELISPLDYDTAMRHMVEWSTSDLSSTDYCKYVIANEFLGPSSTQATDHGLKTLTQTMRPYELAVLFRFNHFCTITSDGSNIYMLVTDYGYKNEENVVWETVTIKGGGAFHQSEFFKAGKKGNDDQLRCDEELARKCQKEYNAADMKGDSNSCTLL